MPETEAPAKGRGRSSRRPRSTSRKRRCPYPDIAQTHASQRIPFRDRFSKAELEQLATVIKLNVRKEKLHGLLLDREQREHKAKRLGSLAKRQENKALFEALERRAREDVLGLRVDRAQLQLQLQRSALAAVELRRDQCLQIPKPASESSAYSKAVCASILVAFALPLLIAVASDFIPARHIVVVARHAQKAKTERVQQIALHVAKMAQPATRPQMQPPTQPQSRPQPKQQPTHSHVTIAPQPATNVSVPVKTAMHNIKKPARHITVARRPAASVGESALARLQKRAAALIAAIFGSSKDVQSGAPATTKAVKTRPIMAAPGRAMPKPGMRVAAVPPSLEARTVRSSQSLLIPTKHPHASPWSIDADGKWVATVRAPSSLHRVDFSSSGAQLIALEPQSGGSDAAIVSIASPQAVVVRMDSPYGNASRTLPAPDAEPAAFEATAQAIGPHMVNVGWTPLTAAAHVSGYRVYRSSGEGEAGALIAQLPAAQHTYHDKTVEADSRYRYVVEADMFDDPVHANADIVATPPELPIDSVNALAGKGMFLYFSSFENDERYFRRFDPQRVISEARAAGIRCIELRLARGSSRMAQSPAALAWLDRLIDAAATSNIKLIAWTVPRRVTTEDVAESVASASYTTASGNGFAGLALDLETGDRYMGTGPRAKQNMVDYIDAVRSAVGDRYLIIATVASPEMGHLTNRDYPYAAIANYASVMQPMEYWHYYNETAHHEYAHGEVAGASAAAVIRTRELAGRDIPVNIAGQSIDLTGTGSPSAREILWSMNAAKSVGAIGETFFDWAGTKPDAWAAIQAFEW